MTDKPLFQTAPREVVDYFDRRPAVPTFDWRDIAPREHALAFTVAKTHGAEVLKDLQDAVRKAVVDRVPYEQFRDELIPTLRKKGWWGEKKVKDPKTQEYVKAQLGSPRRLRIIYWANVHAAHAAGEWARVERNKEFLPWLTYMPSVSERKRPLHISWYGTTLPVDDPWWRSHYPPNGWNCKCSVRQIGDREAGRLHKEFGRDKTPPLDERAWHNKRTGETEMVPAGIDPGWQHNPGLLRDRTLSRGLQTSLDLMPEAARRAAVDALTKHPVAKFTASGAAADDLSAVFGQISDASRNALQAKTSIVRLSGGSARHVLEHKEMTPQLLEGAADMLAGGAIFKDGRSIIVFATIGGALYRLVIKHVPAADALFISTMHRSSERNLTRARRFFELVEGEVPGGS